MRRSSNGSALAASELALEQNWKRFLGVLDQYLQEKGPVYQERSQYEQYQILGSALGEGGLLGEPADRLLQVVGKNFILTLETVEAQAALRRKMSAEAEAIATPLCAIMYTKFNQRVLSHPLVVTSEKYQEQFQRLLMLQDGDVDLFLHLDTLDQLRFLQKHCLMEFDSKVGIPKAGIEQLRLRRAWEECSATGLSLDTHFWCDPVVLLRNQLDLMMGGRVGDGTFSGSGFVRMRQVLHAILDQNPALQIQEENIRRLALAFIACVPQQQKESFMQNLRAELNSLDASYEQTQTKISEKPIFVVPIPVVPIPVVSAVFIGQKPAVTFTNNSPVEGTRSNSIAQSKLLTPQRLGLPLQTQRAASETQCSARGMKPTFLVENTTGSSKELIRMVPITEAAFEAQLDAFMGGAGNYRSAMPAAKRHVLQSIVANSRGSAASSPLAVEVATFMRQLEQPLLRNLKPIFVSMAQKELESLELAQPLVGRRP